jgi:hypothetical protein
MAKLSARSQSGTLNTASVMHAVNDPSGTPTSSKETLAALRTAITLGATTDLGAGTALTINTAYHVALSAIRTLTFTGTPAEGDLNYLKLAVTGGPHVLTIPTSSRTGTDGTTTSISLTTGTHVLVWRYINAAWVLGDSGTVTQTDQWDFGFRAGADESYNLIQSCRFAGTIVNTITKSVSGTATYTFKINTTALGGTANSVSSTEQTQAHASANAFVVGDTIVVTKSANSACVDATATIEFTREV